MRICPRALLVVVLLVCAPPVLVAQSTKGKATNAPKPSPTPEAPQQTGGSKRNERPNTGVKPAQPEPSEAAPTKYVPVYFYEFSREGFVYEKILIEHDESGVGTITFGKGGSYENVTDPIRLSASTLEKIKNAFSALNFLDSSEDYQTPRDYSHMGNNTFRITRDGRSREAKYNWTENKDAKLLMDEYRRISNEYTWRFEILSARENQPLLTPGLIDMLDSYLRRGEISDPPTLLPFLTKLSTDERLPLMARNHTSRLIKQIEKSIKK